MYYYSLLKVGKSDFMIRKKLKEKGISEESIRECIIRLERDSEISELAAAIITAKRKRLGPYRKTKNGKNQPRCSQSGPKMAPKTPQSLQNLPKWRSNSIKNR